MGKFDKYGGSGPLLPGSSSGGTSIIGASKAHEIIAKAQTEAKKADSEKLIYGEKSRVAIALDATGSMANLIGAAKRSIGKIIERASKEAARPIEIEIFVYRDYDVSNIVMQRSGLTSETGKLVAWLNNVTTEGGGGNDGEAVEAALQAIHEQGHFLTVLLAGDEPSNSPVDVAKANLKSRTAIELAHDFKARKIPIYTFVVGSDPRTINDFKKISDVSGGQSGRLDGSEEMIDLAVMAILANLKGRDSVKRYMDEASLSKNAKDFGKLLIGSSK